MSCYNKTLLYSGSSGVYTCTLSESATNFRRIQICSNSCICEIPSVTGVSDITFNRPGGSWSNEGYLLATHRASISADGKTLTISGFNLLGSNSTTPYYWGNDVNHSNNIKGIQAVYGVDRIDYVDIIGAGSPGTGWSAYNETLLWSGSNTNIIELSESAGNFERLRIKVGTSACTPYYKEYDAPTTDNDKLTILANNSESVSIYNWGWSRWTWSDRMTKLTSEYGKSARQTGTSSSSFTGNLNNDDTDFNKRPILEIVGINRKQ